jgi:hypothetical protein
MSHLSSRIHHVIVMLVASGLVAFGFSSGSAAAPTISSPTLTSTQAWAPQAGTLVIAGESFTPGGVVFVALYDQWAEELYETRWIVAGLTTYGPDGSLDPATGYRQGGTFQEIFDGLCGAEVMVRAYDQVADAWSNVVDVEAGCAP